MPFRNDDHAAILRAAKLAEENAALQEEIARLREEAARKRDPTAHQRLRGMERVQRLLAVSASLMFIGFGLTVFGLSHVHRPATCFGHHAHAGVHRTAVLASFEGKLPFKTTRCDLDVVPVSSWHTASGVINCHARIQCGDAVVFGAGNAGFEECTEAGGLPVAIKDEIVTRDDGDPALTVNLAAGTASLHDDVPAGGYTARFTLEGP
jgi:hypothetical protein